MKAILSKAATLARAFALVACAAAPAFAQTGAQERGRLRLESLDSLRGQASEHVVVDVDASLLRFATAMLDDDNPDERQAKQFAAGLKGVYVRVYEFKAEGQYASALAAVRGQLAPSGWSKMVDVKSDGGGADNVEVYLLTEAGRVDGLAFLGAGPKKITVVNIVGSIDMAQLRRLEGKLGIPKIRIGGGADGEGEKTKRP